MLNLKNIREHMPVVCSNYVQFGTVDRIEGLDQAHQGSERPASLHPHPLGDERAGACRHQIPGRRLDQGARAPRAPP